MATIFAAICYCKFVTINSSACIRCRPAILVSTPMFSWVRNTMKHFQLKKITQNYSGLYLCRHFGDGRSMLNLIIESKGSRRLAPVTTTPTGFSDHSLLTTKPQCTKPPALKVTYFYGNLERMDAIAFESSLRRTDSFKSASPDPEIVHEPLLRNLKAILETHGTLKFRTR